MARRVLLHNCQKVEDGHGRACLGQIPERRRQSMDDPYTCPVRLPGQVSLVSVSSLKEQEATSDYRSQLIIYPCYLVRLYEISGWGRTRWEDGRTGEEAGDRRRQRDRQ